MYIDVHTQCLSPASSLSLPPHRPGKENGQAKAGLTPPHSAPPHPTARPETLDPGPVGRKQELGLPYFAHRIQLLFCIVFLWPLLESGGWGRGQIYATIFIHSLFRVGWGFVPLLPLAPFASHSGWVSVSACFHCCGGRLFELPPPPWSPGVWNGGGICLKRHFIIIKSIFTKPMLGCTWDEGPLRGGSWWALDSTLESRS